ncbi:MAG: asparagine synthase (glutamine-hydrolyzing) [Parcubacteria group bacterium]
MCGIFGTINSKKTKEIGRIAFELLRHRGPDDRGIITFPQGMMLNTRLSIIDLSPTGHQPMVSRDENIYLVFNGEIYNYLELKDELKRDYIFRTNTDTEVIIAAYQKWGENCLNKFRGMFAFGLWDKKQKKLFCATDRFSIKQIYYYCDKNTFIFSSEIKPILASGVKAKPNDQAIYDFLSFGFQDHDENTFFKNIYQLRPAHYLLFKDGKLKMKRYWDKKEEEIGILKENKKEILNKLDKKLRETIAYHLRSDVEVGLSLSSGLDSNMVRAIATDLLGSSKRIKCFNFSFVNTIYDEKERLVKLNLKDKRCDFYSTPITPDDFFKNYSELIYIIEEPISGLGIYAYWLNCQHVHERGIKVLLDGQGGDEAFGGYKYYYYHRFLNLWKRKRLKELQEEIKAFNLINQDNIKFPDADFDKFLQKNTIFGAMKAPDGTSLAADYLASGFAKKFKKRNIKPEKKFESSLRNAIYNDLIYFKIPKLLRFQDKASMSWSVETRVPFLDHELIDLAFSLPEECLLRNGVGKYAFKKIGERYIEQSLMKIPKLYVATPQREWIRHDLKKEIIKMIDDSVLQKEGYVDAKKLKAEYNNYLQQKDLGNSFFIWKFFSLELWYRNFIR